MAWLEDFEAELTDWINEGDHHIVISGDMNEDIFHEDIRGLFER